MKTDADLQTAVIDSLKWEPSIHHEHIGVEVSEGVVTLTGTVPTFIEKYNAEKVVEKVPEVKAIVEKIKVKLLGSMIRGDEDIAKAILEKFKWSVLVPDDKVSVTVADGWVTLNGTVDWEYQRKAAERQVRETLGVKFVSNNLELKPSINPVNVKEKIQKALVRAAQRESNKISIAVNGSKVTLSGKVRSLAEKSLVEGTTWGCPGITEIQDNLSVASI